MAAKVTKVFGNESMGNRRRPQRLDYGKPTTEAPNTMRADRIEDVFIPYYDRPGYVTDNANQADLNGKAFEIPSGDGRIVEAK